MNFLAHLHLASLAGSSLTGNLMADYVRGDPHGVWPQHIALGIQLHRRIDAMTDSLPEVRAARRLFRPETFRVAPVALDVIWDHFLSLHWDTIQPEISLPVFLADCYSVIQPELAATPERFQTLNRYLWTERWMERYADASYLEKVLNGIAARRPRLTALSASYQDFVDNYQNLADIFWQLYPQMMSRAVQQQL
ncbi:MULTISPECIES: ACP phosphodiesterase [Erwinia]|uniref:ACP phosphodiesterase n=2 Tax=Erwinia TaxID=551 RepID=A0A014M5C4_9GAMM|nr:ACP phosphodiesterase [Erwinia mallotivora]EXU77046.1 ACP phosphodiesterase [Erwinia mallotivora]